MRTVEMMTISPAMAAEWLRSALPNRHRRESFVNFLVSEIKKGRWQPHAGMFVFNGKGGLIDGQHRAAAIEIAAIPVEGVVCRGADHDTVVAVDTGAKRTGGDLLTIIGHTRGQSFGNANLVASTAYLIMLYEHSKGKTFQAQTGGPDRLSRFDLLQWLKKNPDIEASVKIGALASKNLKCGKASIFGAIHWVLSAVDEEAASTFMTGLVTGEALPSGSPILALRNGILQSVIQEKKMTAAELAQRCLAAWNAWRTKRRLTNLRISQQMLKSGLPHLV